jgi:hypothetical protein
MPTRRDAIRKTAMALLAGLAVVVPVVADDLLATVKSVDPAARKFVVTSNADYKDLEISITSATHFEGPKGKALPKFTLERLNPGGTVEITHVKGVASKIILRKGAFKKKAAS